MWPWFDCAQRARQEHGIPPRSDTDLDVPCDVIDALYGLFLLLLWMGASGNILTMIGIGPKIDWRLLLMSTGIALLVGGIFRFITWVPLRYLNNVHVTPPDVHTSATGPCKTKFMYAWSSIGHWPKIGWAFVSMVGFLIFGRVVQTIGADVIRGHGRLFEIIYFASGAFGFVVTIIWGGYRFLPWFYNHPYAQKFKKWLGEFAIVAGLQSASDQIDVSRTLESQRQRSRRPDGTVEHAPPRSFGDGFTNSAGIARDTIIAPIVKGAAAYTITKFLMNFIWMMIPVVLVVLAGFLGIGVAQALIGGFTTAMLMGVMGGLKAIGQGIVAGICCTLLVLGMLYAHRCFWRAVAELLRWIMPFWRPSSGPYRVSV